MNEISIEKLLQMPAAENVNLDTVIAYKKDGIRHSFPDDYAHSRLNLLQ